MSAPKNERAPAAPYFTPLTSPPTGTALSANPPTLFKPLQIRSTTFQNRIWIAPMCQYSAENGHLTDYHLVHVGAFALRGASLTILEATAVRPEGRITPEDSGLWADSQIAPMKRVADFVHSQGHKLGVQLAHAGRKASTVAPWLVRRGEAQVATADVNGWPDNCVGPSAIPHSEGYPNPREMTKDDIKDVIDGFRDAAVRAVKAGIDVIEIHGAHGYLLCSFNSPLSNQRTDEYGGTLENRLRLNIEVIKAVREVIPHDMPLLYRISASEWVDGKNSWDLPQTIDFAKMMPALGVDLLDVSSGGNSVDQRIPMHNSYQVDMAGEIRNALKAANLSMLVGAVGMITEAEQARDILDGKDPKADVVLVARQVLREPEWVLRVAWRLGVEVQWPSQYRWGKFPKGYKV
ncbi:MAG: hypothetical protein M1819_002657 [Sarea resinae]|nr:MAG: hypothetical protein M1819_002657 [Sarea resinae]